MAERKTPAHLAEVTAQLSRVARREFKVVPNARGLGWDLVMIHSHTTAEFIVGSLKTRPMHGWILAYVRGIQFGLNMRRQPMFTPKEPADG